MKNILQSFVPLTIAFICVIIAVTWRHAYRVHEHHQVEDRVLMQVRNTEFQDSIERMHFQSGVLWTLILLETNVDAGRFIEKAWHRYTNANRITFYQNTIIGEP